MDDSCLRWRRRLCRLGIRRHLVRLEVLRECDRQRIPSQAASSMGTPHSSTDHQPTGVLIGGGFGPLQELAAQKTGIPKMACPGSATNWNPTPAVCPDRLILSISHSVVGFQPHFTQNRTPQLTKLVDFYAVNMGSPGTRIQTHG